MTRKYILSACLFVLAVISGVCYGAENSDRQAQTELAIRKFGQENVERFEQMFQTEEFDFKNGLFNGNILHYAALIGDLNRVKLLVEKGANVNARDFIGASVLHYAAQSGNLELVQWLVKHGSNVNTKDDDGKTVLHSAASSGNVELVKWLIEKGLDINKKSKDKETVLHSAAES